MACFALQKLRRTGNTFNLPRKVCLTFLTREFKPFAKKAVGVAMMSIVLSVRWTVFTEIKLKHMHCIWVSFPPQQLISCTVHQTLADWSKKSCDYRMTSEQ